VKHRVALLTNFIPPYRVAVLKELERRCDSLQILVSSSMQEGLRWAPCHSDLPVTQQRCIHWQETWRHTHRFTERLDIHFPYDTISQLKRFRPNAIVSGELGLRTLQAAAYRQLDRASRLIIWATLSEVTEQARGIVRSILRPGLLRSADAVIVNGESGARYVERHGAGKQRVFRVPQTTNLDGFLALPAVRRSPLRRRLLYAGRLIELKGLIPFLAHLAVWASTHLKEHIEFWILGDGPLRAALASYPTPANLEVRLLGHVAYQRLPEIYSQAGILVFPTLADEWGLVVVEAMASGLPVLGSVYSQAVDDLVVAEKTGWLFRPDDPSQVGAAISQSLTTSPQELDRMGQYARQRVIALTPATMANQIISAIDYAVLGEL
jgi:glycosyltransferase involved in cell wall biosynthesis